MRNQRVISDLLNAALRAAADFAIVHIAMVAALVIVAIQAPSASEEAIRGVLAGLRGYYVGTFLPISFLLPVLYSAAGLYSIRRSYSLATRLRRAALCSGAGGAGLLVAAFMPLSRVDGRTITVIAVFTFLVMAGTVGVRWLKHHFFVQDIRSVPPEALAGDRVLVVGGAGYIGSILVRKLLKQGHRVRVLDSLVYGDSAIADVRKHPRLEFLKGDCRNIKDVVAAMAGARVVVDLAAIVGDPACDQDHKTAREINYAATRMMIEIAKGRRVERFIFASSCSVYGASQEVMDEESEVRPISLYADTKVDSEHELLNAATREFHPVVLRFATIFGLSPRPRFDLVVNLLTAKAIQEGVVTIYNGEQWRPFLHVADAAEAILRTVQAPTDVVGGQIYNVGDSSLNHTLTDVADAIVGFFPRTKVEHVENSDRRTYRVSFDKIRRDLGFSCTKTLRDGIAEIRDAFASGRIRDYRNPLYSNVQFLKKHGSPEQKDVVGAQVMAALAQKA
jgi:nucleoside-diphosphate-sugar epimerase